GDRRFRTDLLLMVVMPGLDPGIQSAATAVWIAGSSPAMTALFDFERHGAGARPRQIPPPVPHSRKGRGDSRGECLAKSAPLLEIARALEEDLDVLLHVGAGLLRLELASHHVADVLGEDLEELGALGELGEVMAVVNAERDRLEDLVLWLRAP